MAKTKRQPDIETIIEKAVNAGLKAGRREAEDIYIKQQKRDFMHCETVKKGLDER